MWQEIYDFELIFSLIQDPGKASTIQIYVASHFPVPRLMEPPRDVLIHVIHTDDTESVSEMKLPMRGLRSAGNACTFWAKLMRSTALSPRVVMDRDIRRILEHFHFLFLALFYFFSRMIFES